MTGPAIRRAGAGDASALAALHGASFADGWDAPSIARLVGGPGGFALIASNAAGADCGFAILQCVPPEAELLSVGVPPACRRAGIARALIRRAAADLAASGGEIMFLDVASDNAAARALYGALGFRDISKRARYYKNGADAIVMRATLADIAAGKG
jgi:ribosomal-protein-alanine N-acetyltransferase